MNKAKNLIQTFVNVLEMKYLNKTPKQNIPKTAILFLCQIADHAGQK